MLQLLRSEGWVSAFVYMCVCHIYSCTVFGILVWVCVRSQVPCCMLWYLGSGSWARPSGSLRSRRSEACNYWSPPGPLWGRYGSSDACCSCADAQENLKKEEESKCVSAHVCVCIRQTAELFLVWTAWVKQSHWRETEAKWVCVSGQVTQSKAHWPLEVYSPFPTAEWKQICLKNIRSDPPFSSHLGDLNLLSLNSDIASLINAMCSIKNSGNHSSGDHNLLGVSIVK